MTLVKMWYWSQFR